MLCWFIAVTIRGDSDPLLQIGTGMVQENSTSPTPDASRDCQVASALAALRRTDVATFVTMTQEETARSASQYW